jgi:hypothetical protein
MRIVYIYVVILIGAVACSRGNAGNLDSKFSADDNSDAVKIDRTPVSNEKFSPLEYVNWVGDITHGLKRVRAFSNYIYTAQFKPWEYIVCEEQRKEAIPDSVVKKRLKDLNGMQYVDLKIELKEGEGELLKYGLTNPKEYDERIDYFSFGMQKDIKLVEAGDTLSCLLFHFERVYNIAPSATFLLAFPLGKVPKGDKTLVFIDHGFNQGIIKFFFDGRDIKNVPQLETL